MRTTAQDVLIVIDVQNDFCPGGALTVAHGDAVVEAIHGIAPKFEHIILTQDWHTPGHSSFASSHPGKKPYDQIELSYRRQTLWPDHCIQGTPARNFTRPCICPRRNSFCAKAFARTSIRIRPSLRMTASRRRALPATCANAT